MCSKYLSMQLITNEAKHQLVTQATWLIVNDMPTLELHHAGPMAKTLTSSIEQFGGNYGLEQTNGSSAGLQQSSLSIRLPCAAQRSSIPIGEIRGRCQM